MLATENFRLLKKNCDARQCGSIKCAHMTVFTTSEPFPLLYKHIYAKIHYLITTNPEPQSPSFHRLQQ